MTTLKTCALLFLGMIVAVNAQSQAIPNETKQTVAFVYVPGADGKPTPSGTGFFIEQKTKDNIFIYFVTAGHVLRQGLDGPTRERLWIRLNTKVGGVDYIEVRLAGGNTNTQVFFHPDPTVDLAMIPWAPDTKVYEYKHLSTEYLVKTADLAGLSIREGTNVFFIGLFNQSVSTARNVPIVRFGRVAMAPGERVHVAGVERDVLLIEGASYGGNSGAPVYYDISYRGEFRLAGVMSGAFLDLGPVLTPNAAGALAATQSIARSNLGIAFVVPSERLAELLFLPAVKAMRGE